MRIFALFITLFCAVNSLLAQDIGVERIIYPTTSYTGYEINSVIPVHYVIKNYGERIEDKEIQVTLNPDMSSPVSVNFTTTLSEGAEVKFDPRKESFYNNGLAEIPGINGVLYMQTPEAGVGDTLKVCIEVLMEGDTNPLNDELCLEFVLIAPLNRDLSMEIVGPSDREEIPTWSEMEVEMEISNNGSITYNNDSLFFQAQLQIQGQRPITFNTAVALSDSISPGESLNVTAPVEISRDFPETTALFCFNVLWMARDNVVQLLETDFENNDDCIEVKVVKSTMNENPLQEVTVRNDVSGLVLQNIPTQTTVTFINMNGQSVFNSESHRSELFISSSALPQGIYLLQLNDKSGHIYTEKVYLR